MYNIVIRKSNEIAKQTRRGPGNWAVADITAAAALETVPTYTIHPVAGNVDTSIYGVSKIGTLDGRMTLYRDTFYNTNSILVGYKGASAYDTGIVYLPYIQLMVSKANDYDSFQPAAGMLTRYGIHTHLFGAANYYENINITNMPS